MVWSLCEQWANRLDVNSPYYRFIISTYSTAPLPSLLSVFQSHNSVRWSTVIKHITDIYTQILSVLHHEFIPAAALYISVHVDRLIQVNLNTLGK